MEQSAFMYLNHSKLKFLIDSTQNLAKKVFPYYKIEDLGSNKKSLSDLKKLLKYPQIK